MAEVVLFHHIRGLTAGIEAFADDLRDGGHTVHTPDLFEGARPETIDDGMAFADTTGGEVLSGRADAAVADLPEGLVYAGFSFGAGEAQRWRRPGRVRGALLYEGCMPITGEWAIGRGRTASRSRSTAWTRTRSSGRGRPDFARELVDTVGPELAELFVYPGDQHLFTDRSLMPFDAEATAQVVERSRVFLDRLD